MEKYIEDITLWRLINRFLTYEEKYHLSNRNNVLVKCFMCILGAFQVHFECTKVWNLGEHWKSCLQLREVQNYLASEEFEHLRNKLESDRICNRGFWQKNVHQENRFFRVLDLLIYLGKRTSSVAIIWRKWTVFWVTIVSGVETDKDDAIVEKTECQTEKWGSK